MALLNIFGWNEKEKKQAGTACGAGDKPEEKPSACGTACGAGDRLYAGSRHFVPAELGLV